MKIKSRVNHLDTKTRWRINNGETKEVPDDVNMACIERLISRGQMIVIDKKKSKSSIEKVSNEAKATGTLDTKDAKNLLNQNTRTVKNQLTKHNLNEVDLNLLEKSEKAGKKRKGVLASIRRLLGGKP